jgi:glycosyltransferase involved in cell wall biosynthesis
MVEAKAHVSNPSVSVLIPVYNGEKTVGPCIESVLAQRYAGALDVLVVDDASADGTPAVLSGYAGRIRTLRNAQNSGIAKTYNRALAESAGEIVLTLASDCALVSSDYVERLVRHFDDSLVGAVAGKAIMPHFDAVPPVERIFTRLNVLDVNDPDRGIHEVNFVEVRCDGFRRAVFDRVGGLNEDLFRSNEDQDLSVRITRAGYRLLQDNSLEFELGFGGTSDSLRKLLSKQGQYARGQSYIAVNYGVGSRDGLWTNANRRLRAVHRMSQVAVGPLALVLAAAGFVFRPAWWGLAVLLALRSFYYLRLTGDLRPGERAAAVPLGLVCDAIYSAAFLSGAALWIGRGKSALHSARAAGLSAAKTR